MTEHSSYREVRLGCLPVEGLVGKLPHQRQEFRSRTAHYAQEALHFIARDRSSLGVEDRGGIAGIKGADSHYFLRNLDLYWLTRPCRVAVRSQPGDVRRHRLRQPFKCFVF